MDRVSKGWALWWRDLYDLWWSLVGCLFRDNLSLSLGNGRSVKFWLDLWLEGKVCLKDRFPRLFAISPQKVVSF